MIKMTLLEIVQDILSDMNSFPVNSISDTEESLQVAGIVKSTFLTIVTHRKWPQHRRLLQLSSSIDISKPTHLVIDVDVSDIILINYNKRDIDDLNEEYSEVKFLEAEDFLTYTNYRSSSDTDDITVVKDYYGVELLIGNSEPPKYYTSFDNKHLVFDSYDKEVDATIQNSKLQILAYASPKWGMNDYYVPDLPAKAFQYLLAEAKSTCFATIKQMPNAKEEQKATRLRQWLALEKFTVGGKLKVPDYGRK